MNIHPDPRSVEIVEMLLAERRRLYAEYLELGNDVIAEKAEVPLDYVKQIAKERKSRKKPRSRAA